MTASLQRRTFTGTIAALGLGAMLTAAAPFAAAQTIADLRKNRALTVGLLVDFPPYGTTDAHHQPDGYDADVARLLAKDLGLQLNLVPVTGPNRIPFLLARKVDLLIASLTVTPERAKQVTFSLPYSAATIVLYGSRNARISNAADLGNMRVAAVRDSSGDLAVTSSAPRGTGIRRFDDDASAIQALTSGQVDAIACSPRLAARIARGAPAPAFEEKFVLRRQQMAIAMRPGQDELLKAVDDFVARNTASGELSRLYRRWLDSDLPAMK